MSETNEVALYGLMLILGVVTPAYWLGRLVERSRHLRGDADE